VHFHPEMNLLDKALFPGFNPNPPVITNAIEQFETKSGVHLPDDYAAFLRQSNGGEGFLGKGYVNFWRIEEIIEKNKRYKSAEFAPGLLLFGSDGGGEAFAFDNRLGQQPIVSVPFIPLDAKEARTLAPTFATFIEGILNS
jgi:SMI1/KNR4 family protein SUKH-1